MEHRTPTESEILLTRHAEQGESSREAATGKAVRSRRTGCIVRIGIDEEREDARENKYYPLSPLVRSFGMQDGAEERGTLPGTEKCTANNWNNPMDGGIALTSQLSSCTYFVEWHEYVYDCELSSR